MPHWTDTAAELCRKVASPALDDCAVRILNADDSPEAAKYLPRDYMGVTGGAYAFLPLRSCGSTSSLPLSGRDFVTIISPTRIVENWCSRFAWQGPISPVTVDRLCVNVVLHELAHFLEWRWIHNDLSRLAGRELPLLVPTSETFAALGQPPAPPAEPWHQHGAQFVRTAIHVAHRASTAPANLTAADRHYGLSPVGQYAAALGNEVETQADVPIVDILATDAPEEFTDLFTRDCFAWHQSQLRAA